jgi:hypothetical protein
MFRFFASGRGRVLFGMGQAAGHGVIFPRVAGDKYGPGFLASALLHGPGQRAQAGAGSGSAG